jgi:hypothetical protein
MAWISLPWLASSTSPVNTVALFPSKPASAGTLTGSTA